MLWSSSCNPVIIGQGLDQSIAKLREASAKNTKAHSDKTYEDVWDDIIQQELDYYKKIYRSPQEKGIKIKRNTGILMTLAGIRAG